MTSSDLSTRDLVIGEPGAVFALLLQRPRHQGVRLLAAEVDVGEVREGGVRVGQYCPCHVGVSPATPAS